MNKKERNNYWKGIPEELKYMCLAEVHGTGNYCTRPVIKYLLDHMYDCDTYVFEATPYEIIRCIDIGIETCLFPLEQHDKDWTESLGSIEKILYRSEELIEKIAPADYRGGYRTTYDSRYEYNIIEYAQKLDLYFCVLHMFSKEWNKLQDRLKWLLAYTKQNVGNMINSENAEKYASWDDWAEFHFPGTDVWEPINWLYREAIPNGNARKLFARTYQKYAIYLAELENSRERSAALTHLRTNAEKRLKHICEVILDEIAEEKETLKGDDEQLLADEVEFEKMLRLSEDRSHSIGKMANSESIEFPF